MYILSFLVFLLSLQYPFPLPIQRNQWFYLVFLYQKIWRYQSERGGAICCWGYSRTCRIYADLDLFEGWQRRSTWSAGFSTPIRNNGFETGGWSWLHALWREGCHGRTLCRGRSRRARRGGRCHGSRGWCRGCRWAILYVEIRGCRCNLLFVKVLIKAMTIFPNNLFIFFHKVHI